MSHLFLNGVIFKRARISLALLSLRKNGGLLVFYLSGTSLAKLLLSAIATLPQLPPPPDPPPLLPDHQILLQWQKVLVTEKWNTKVNNALL